MSSVFFLGKEAVRASFIRREAMPSALGDGREESPEALPCLLGIEPWRERAQRLEMGSEK